MTGQDLTEAIRERAYGIWMGEGCPQGRDHIHWLRAEAEFREKFLAEHTGDSCKVGFHERPAETRGHALDPSAAEGVDHEVPNAQPSERQPSYGS